MHHEKANYIIAAETLTTTLKKINLTFHGCLYKKMEKYVEF